MPVTLDRPFSWRAAAADDAAMLNALQPNIIHGHTREFLTILYLRFTEENGARRFLRSLVEPSGGTPLMKSAMAHLAEIDAFKADSTPGAPYVGVGISASGYAALGVPDAVRPSDPSFRAGMKAASLEDPAPEDWETPLNSFIDAAVLVGDSAQPARDAALGRLQTLLAASSGVVVLGSQEGFGQHNANGEGIEHFGYVDGRSQPHFLTEDIDEERLRRDGISAWDPAFAPSRVLVPDAASPDPELHFGSYFVLRKLEQNVRKFKQQEEALAASLGLTAADAERAGAMVVGRFEDGTPLTAQSAEGACHPVPNDFNYDSDPDGGKCPFFAHIRKMNPRGSGGFETHEDERLHIMARRGQTYGVRTDGLNDGRLDNKPEGGVGLLFMAFNADIGQQFEFVQSLWGNNPGFPKVDPGRPLPGLDQVIGQTPGDGPRPPAECPLSWGARPQTPGAFASAPAVERAVTMLGGEYFFMPSLPMLASL